MKVLLRIQFLGTEFCGYQVQGRHRTVQREMNRAVKELYGCDCNVTGCSRTDSGVHANEFFLTVEPQSADAHVIPIERTLRAITPLLPYDISATGAWEVPDSFHARHDVLYKEYEYLILNRSQRDVFLHGRAYHFPLRIEDAALEDMKFAAAKLVGRRDFASFMAERSSVEDTVREIMYATIDREGDLIKIKIAADGFLYNMVRIITGTLLDISQARISPLDTEDIIASCDRSRAGFTAPPQGLYLNKVTYKK